jgi:uncharacterized protein (DUF2235 family)
MSKNIVICCDGTGNEYGDHNSYVVKVYRTLVINDAQQVAYYHPGVGTMGAPTARNRLEMVWTMLTGLAFGGGLLDNVADAYRYLMEIYKDGDQVYLFGFSRGAYTVRALAGLLHMFGLLCPGNNGLIPYVTRMYAKRTREAKGMEHTFAVAEGFKQTFCRDCPLHFVGVWDTVSSVGLIWNPVRLPYTAQNPLMRIGRHAVSIDERRCYFRNNLWGAPLKDQDIQQVWFAGVHSDVGGSYAYAECGLSQISFEWMLCEAVTFGLIVDANKAKVELGRMPPHPPVPADARGQVHNSLTWSWWLLEVLPHRYYDVASQRVRWRIPLGARRLIPEGSVLHRTVNEKRRLDSGYKPANLPKNGLEASTIPCNFESPHGGAGPLEIQPK